MQNKISPGATPVFLDWQYIHLNKGVSDIVFLLVESIKFDQRIVDLVVNYYFQLVKEKANRRPRATTSTALSSIGSSIGESNRTSASAGGVAGSITVNSSPQRSDGEAPASLDDDALYTRFMRDFKLNLCLFPYFVMVWFNSEDPDKLIDKSFPMRFMKNLLDYFTHFLDPAFFDGLEG